MMIGLGVFGFFAGFRNLHKKRMIENIPTSTIRGMAMGTVEIIGQAEACPALLTAPLTDTPCVYYKYKIEERRSSGKSRRWVTIMSGDSCNSPFYVRDDTGRVLVSPQKAEMILPKDLSTTSWNESKTIWRFMIDAGIKPTGFLGFSRPLRFTEWHVKPGEKIYILGHAGKNKDFHKAHQQELVARLNAIKSDREAIKKVDLNKDGEISEEEWSLVVKRIEQDMLEKSIAASGNVEHPDVIIAYNPNAKMYLISDKSQKDLLHAMTWKSLFFIWGGAALAVFGLFLLLMELNLL